MPKNYVPPSYKNYRMLYRLLLLVILVIPCTAQVVPYQGSTIGFNAGLHFSVGSHIQRVGLFTNFYFIKNHFQANTELRYSYNFRYLGPRLKHGELQLSQGLLYTYGPANARLNPFITVLSNQTAYQNSFGYVYQLYLNNIGTKQQTGIIAIQVQDYSLYVENDLFAKPALDRFKTGAIALLYNYKMQWQGGIKAMLWTGQMGHKHSTESMQIRSHCYMDTSGGKFTNYSHGILLAQFDYNLGYSQIGSLSAGVDAEQVRNALQNKLLHDQVFLPKAWRNYKNCHIPMLDKNGNLFLYSEGQQIRKPNLFINGALNQSVLY